MNIWKKPTRIPGWLAPAGLLALLLPAGARADKALVVGINHYPHLDDGNLDGCANDADSMKAALKTRGFEVTELKDAEASKEGILNGLRAMKAQIKPGERFVFYFAGHGSHDSAYKCCLLASDAEETNFDHVLYKEDLQGAINDIPAVSRTILLDACHSEGLLRGKGLRFHRTRYHRLRVAPRSKKLPNLNETDNNKEIVADGLCGFTACTRQQPSGERTFENGDHGVFTYYLAEYLNKGSKEAPWDDLVTTVSSKVAADMDQQQTPVFGPNVYRRVRVFDPRSGDKPDPTPSDRTIWDDYVDNKANASYLQVKFSLGPEVKSVKKGQKFSIIVQSGEASGYLILLNKDTSDKIYLMSPDPEKTSNVDDLVKKALVQANTTRTIDTEGVDLGTERVKAILFRSEDDARALISKFPKDGATARQLMGQILARRLPNQGEADSSQQWTYYTSMIQVDVVSDKEHSDDEDGQSADSGASSRFGGKGNLHG